jgi:hypothetical protein
MTVHEDVADRVLEKFQESPDAMYTLTALRNSHIRGEMDEGDIWGSGYADALGSSARFEPQRWPLRQHAAFLKLHTLVGSGQVAFTYISTGGPPGPDRDRAGNAALLTETYPPFTAHLDMEQNGASSDGSLSWSEELEISRPTGAYFYEDTCKRVGQTPLILPATRKAGSAPLEVGDSWPSCTLMHLWRHRAVARWPYGSNLIWLFLNYSWGHDRNA